MLRAHSPNIYSVQKGYRHKVRGPRWNPQKIEKIQKIPTNTAMIEKSLKLLEQIPRDEIVDVEPLYNKKFQRKPRLTRVWEKRNGQLVHYPTAKVLLSSYLLQILTNIMNLANILLHTSN